MDIPAIQKRIIQNKLNHGFNMDDIGREFLYLYGEVGEAYDAYSRGLPAEELGLELADVAIYLLGIAELLGFDMNNEILKKIKINEGRVYETLPDGSVVKVETDQ
ncbi:MAG: hypothetical protein IJ757_06050 [Clostridiales bacterium]|nr:hypothetical protein [Clostridiales bacterium]